MKRLFGIVAAVALASVASVAQAADNAWFSLQSSSGVCDITSVNGAPGAQTGGASGQALSVVHGAGKQNNCVLTIGYNFTSATPMAGWAFRLNQPTGAAAGTYVAGGVAHVGVGYNTPVNVADANLINISNASTSSSGSSGLVVTFTLASPNGKPNGVHDITGDFGGSEQRYASGYRWYGRVAGGPLSYGSPAYTGGPDNTAGWGPQAVISLTNVPEPATLALLGFGALALIRRRR